MNDHDRKEYDSFYEEFFAYLDGNAPRPDMSKLPDDIAAEFAAIEIAERVSKNVDIEMIPEFESDPVAVRLGFRSGVDEQRISGGSLAESRRRRGLSVEELADLATAQGVTVTAADITAMEDQAWSTTASSILAELAAVLEIDESDLRIRRPTWSESVTERLIGLGLPLEVAEDTDPVLDAITGHSTSLIVAYLDLRVRTVLLTDVAADLIGEDDQLRTAQLVLRLASDTSAVALIAEDSEATTQIVEPADVSAAVSVPSGRLVWFVPARSPMALELAFHQFFERLVPQWDALDITAPVTRTESRQDLIISLAESVVASASSSRYKIVEKKLAYSTLSVRDAHAIVSLVPAITKGLDEDDLFARLDEMAELAP